MFHQFGGALARKAVVVRLRAFVRTLHPVLDSTHGTGNVSLRSDLL